MRNILRLPISRPSRWALLAVPAFLGAALWVLPLSVVLWFADAAKAGVSARTVDGTVWNGRILDASVSGTHLGDVGLRLLTTDLLIAKLRFQLSGLSAQPVSGEAYAGPTSRGVRNLDARVTLDGGLRLLGLNAAQLTGLSVEFRDGKCVEASGQITANLSEGPLARATGPQLSGPASCDKGRLSLRLTDPQSKAVLTIEDLERTTASYALILRPSDALDKAALLTIGFRDTPVGLRHSGRLPQ